MKKFDKDIERIYTLSYAKIIDLHFRMQEEVKYQYNLRHNPHNLKDAISVCDQAISISNIVLEAMIEKKRGECAEYFSVTGRRSPDSKFYYPSHYAAETLCKIYKELGEQEKITNIQNKMNTEGWGSGRYESVN